MVEIHVVRMGGGGKEKGEEEKGSSTEGEAGMAEGKIEREKEEGAVEKKKKHKSLS